MTLYEATFIIMFYIGLRRQSAQAYTLVSDMAIIGPITSSIGVYSAVDA